MSAQELTTEIAVQGTQPDYFTMLPNMAIIDLSANAYKLLAIYLDTAKTNQVYAKNSTISKKLGVTVNTMKKARKELADKGYIIFASGKDGADTTTARVVIQINWMWSENSKRMSKSDTQEEKDNETVSNSDRGVSKFDTVVSNSDTNNQELKNKELKDKDIAEQETPKKKAPDGMYEAIQDVFGLHGGLNVDYQKLLLGTATKKQYEPYNLSEPITPDELREWDKWYRRTVFNNDKSLTMVKAPAKIQSSIMEYRATKQVKQETELKAPERDLQDIHQNHVLSILMGELDDKDISA